MCPFLARDVFCTKVSAPVAMARLAQEVERADPSYRGMQTEQDKKQKPGKRGSNSTLRRHEAYLRGRIEKVAMSFSKKTEVERYIDGYNKPGADGIRSLRRVVNTKLLPKELRSAFRGTTFSGK